MQFRFRLTEWQLRQWSFARFPRESGFSLTAGRPTLFNQLEGKLRAKRQNVPRAGEDSSWPLGVFRDLELLRKVQLYGDKLFSAIGYVAMSKTGFW